MECKHRKNICMYENGFYCYDCKTFFKEDSIIYIRENGIRELWAVFHNMGVAVARKKREMSSKLFVKLEKAKNELFDTKLWNNMDDQELLVRYNGYLELLKEFGATKKDASIILMQ